MIGLGDVSRAVQLTATAISIVDITARAKTTESQAYWLTEKRITVKIYYVESFPGKLSQEKTFLRACLHGGGEPQEGEVTRLAVVEKQNVFTCNLTTPGCWGEVS